MNSTNQATGTETAARRWEFARGLLMTVAFAVALTFAFFPLLWQGGGLVGGDIYPYFYPQKQFYAEAIRSGEIPLWNNRTGHGYPTVGESQTGVFYPFHWAYRFLNLNTAYNSVQLTHYVLAFVGCWLLGRRWGLRTLPACLAATVYTYGWLPTRMCVEWAALGAAWLPVALWCAESFLQTHRRRYLGVMAVVLAIQLLAGHFHLAFITHVTLVGFLLLRLNIATAGVAPASLSIRWTTFAWCLGAIACAFGLAAVQLAPTWELKQLSQRAALGAEHDPGYGFIPWWYLGQMVAPWMFYTPDISLSTPAGMTRTNTVEAHLYCGLLPLILAAIGCVVRPATRDTRNIIWWILGGLAVVYATGTLMPVAMHLPGFGFFNGVGRYGIVVNLAVGLLAAEALQRLVGPQVTRRALLLGMAAILLTACDCWWVSQLVKHSFIVARPPMNFLQSSPIRQALEHQEFAQSVSGATRHPVRLFCRGANIPNLLGVASTPVYLGIGPQAYYDPQLAMPQPLPFDIDPTPEQLDWLRRAGVTHILSFQPLDQAAWQVQLVTATADMFLNRAWGRGTNELFFLYSLDDARGRVYWHAPTATDTAEIIEYRANRVTITAESAEGGTLMLTDLDWPGWNVSMDGRPAEPIRGDAKVAPYRALKLPSGKHTIVWTFQPASLRWGGLLSLTTAVFLLALILVSAFKKEPVTNHSGGRTPPD